VVGPRVPVDSKMAVPVDSETAVPVDSETAVPVDSNMAVSVHLDDERTRIRQNSTFLTVTDQNDLFCTKITL
jgi:hypothetical protein